MITTKYGIRNKITNILLTLNIEAESIVENEFSSRIEYGYSLSTDASLNPWTTDNIEYAVFALMEPTTYEWNGTEDPYSKYTTEFYEIVAIHSFDNTLQVITTDNVIQSVFEIINDIEEYITISHSRPDGMFNKDIVKNSITNFHDNQKSFKNTMYIFCNVWAYLKHKNRIPENKINIATFTKLIQNSLNEVIK
jgi:hypothetical protein